MVPLKPLTAGPFGLRALSLFLFLCLAATGAKAQRRNESITQDNTSIRWRGDWRTVDDPLSIGGKYRIARAAGATAEFTFTGVAVYFEAPQWPFSIRSNVSLDGRRGIVLDLQDTASADGPRTSNATVAAAVHERGVWTNLENRAHTVRITVPTGDQAAVFDNFIITRCTGTCTPETTTTTTTDGTETETTTTPTETPVDGDGVDSLVDGIPVVTSTTTTVEVLPPLTQTVIVVSETARPSSGRSGSQSGTSSSSSSPSKNGLAIGFGVAFGIILLVLIIGIAWWLVRRNRLLREEQPGTPSGHYRGNGASRTRETTAIGAAAGSGAGAGAGVLRVPTPSEKEGEGGSILGRPGVPGGSGTATPMSAGVAGIGVREVPRRHSYDGTRRTSYMMPYQQPEPWADNVGYGATQGRAI